MNIRPQTRLQDRPAGPSVTRPTSWSEVRHESPSEVRPTGPPGVEHESTLERSDVALTEWPDPPQRVHAPRSVGRTGSVLALVGFVAVAQLAGLIGVPFTARGTDGWYDTLSLPSFAPPSWVFAPVWTLLYLMIGVAGWRVWRSGRSKAHSYALTWWGLQLGLNAAWSPLFFGARVPWAAFIEIVVMWFAIALTIGAFRRVDKVSVWLMRPYLAWVTYAAVLNATIAAMN